jgi:hypothetical protein
MLKIIKNDGVCLELKRHKYIFYFHDTELGDMYARISFKSFIGYVLYKLKFNKG